MRLQLPNRIPLGRGMMCIGVLFAVQQVERTDFVFSLLFGVFLTLSLLAFNLAGGFERVVGAYVFFFSTLTCGMGVVWKACLGQPAGSNLSSPNADMGLFTLSMALLLAVVYLLRHLDVRPYALAYDVGSTEVDYTLAGLGSIIVGVAISFGGAVLPAGPGSLLGVLTQLNVFLPLGIILSTIGVMRDSRGTRAIGFVNGLGMSIFFLQGTLAYAKQGMLTPVACWAITAAYMRFKLRAVHIVCLGAFTVFAFTVVPTWATGRDDQPENGQTFTQSVLLAVYEAEHYQDLRDRLDYVHEKDREAGVSGYYGDPQGLMDRLTILPPDDSLVTYTLKGHLYGYSPVWIDIENWFPHFLFPDKPGTVNGNTYAHEVGGLAADDFTTGISYSPSAEAFHLGGWTGALLLLPTVWLAYFLVTDWVCGDLRRVPWPLLPMVALTHSAAESLLSGLIYQIAYGNLAILLAILFTTRVAPILGALFYGKRREPVPLGA
jgi:hypothetical protein